MYHQSLRYGAPYSTLWIIVPNAVLVNTKNTGIRMFVEMHKIGGTEMGTLYENIIALCDERGIKGGKMCTDIGMSKGILTDLKMGRQSGISAANAQKIASYFGVSVGCLLGEEDCEEIKKEHPTENLDGMSEKKKALMEFAMSIPDDKADMILQVMKTILATD